MDLAFGEGLTQEIQAASIPVARQVDHPQLHEQEVGVGSLTKIAAIFPAAMPDQFVLSSPLGEGSRLSQNGEGEEGGSVVQPVIYGSNTELDTVAILFSCEQVNQMEKELRNLQRL